MHGNTNRYDQYKETFRTLAEGMDVIYHESARETGGERHIRRLRRRALHRRVGRDVLLRRAEPPADAVHLRDRAHDQRLDCRHDDYYSTNPAAGSYLANNFNVADNLFLIRGGGAPARSIVNPVSGRCLDVSGGRTEDGTKTQLWDCLNNSAQQWIMQANGNLVNPASGKCLDADAWGTANGTTTILWPCGPGPQANQVWLWR